MSKKELITIELDDEDFFNEFFGKPIKCFEENSRPHEMIKLSLEKAHDIRKFEIELYWKRAAYFFAFFTVITTAFGYLFTHEDKVLYAPGVAIIGILFSICFYFVNIGSKYWQCNWEYIIDKLEVYVTGNLHKVYFYRKSTDLRPSVSNINQIIAVIIVLLWHICFILSLCLVYKTNQEVTGWYILIYLLSSSIIVHKCAKFISDIIDKENKTEKVKTRHFRFRKELYK
ncbi:RipA family octameric membrane protein [Yersinia enterocolitica]|uniref:RipA family octameric membrane protein n=1 Tax=Yersinia enterocolitica TaxID=630 RepID=UPI0029A87AC4|nr:hypothetical protein [Yersinia enterocolitica]HDL7851055.1 hypothetical protein [Yersinia enterocolitica]HEI6796658.1 hypothetical protein [Yersinia enterocolitica]HEN3255550.1 hypothetical protein [Yersinia enterocolitica]